MNLMSLLNRVDIMSLSKLDVIGYGASIKIRYLWTR